MIVFEWFYENNDTFEQLLKVEPKYEVRMYGNSVFRSACIYVSLADHSQSL